MQSKGFVRRALLNPAQPTQRIGIERISRYPVNRFRGEHDQVPLPQRGSNLGDLVTIRGAPVDSSKFRNHVESTVTDVSEYVPSYAPRYSMATQRPCKYGDDSGGTQKTFDRDKGASCGRLRDWRKGTRNAAAKLAVIHSGPGSGPCPDRSHCWMEAGSGLPPSRALVKSRRLP